MKWIHTHCQWMFVKLKAHKWLNFLNEFGIHVMPNGNNRVICSNIQLFLGISQMNVPTFEICYHNSGICTQVYVTLSTSKWALFFLFFLATWHIKNSKMLTKIARWLKRFVYFWFSSEICQIYKCERNQWERRCSRSK